MKKLIAFLLVYALSFCAIASAESLDLTGMSLEELLLLRSAIDSEINSRVTAATTILTPGKYIAGIDIVAGSYILIGLMDEAPNGSVPQVLCAESMEKADKLDYIDSTRLKAAEKWRVTIQNGMVLEVRYGECSIQQAPPLLFAPQ